MKALSELGISPCPWTHFDTFNGANKCRAVGNERNEVIAFCRGRNSIRKSNARLIAAAPELYEALRELVEWCDYDYMSQVENYKPMIAKAKAALAKASGEPVNDRVNDRVNKEAK